MTPDRKSPFVSPHDDDLPDGTAAAEDDSEDGDEDEEGGDGDDQAALALNTPEPAQAVLAADPAVKRKGEPGIKKGKDKIPKDTSGDESSRAIDVALDDKAFGLEDSAAAESPGTETPEMSAFDRDEITDPETGMHETELLGMLAGLHEKPWENEKLSLVERMMLKQGYDRNLEALHPKEPDRDPGAKTRDRGAIKKAAVIGAVAVAAGLGAAASLPGREKGAGMAGVSRGPKRQADQDRAQTSTEAQKPSPSITAQARQNAEEVTLRRFDTGLAARVSVNREAGPIALQQDDPERYDPLRDMIDDLIQDQNQNQIFTAAGPDSSDPDAQFQQMMNMIYASLGTESLMNVSPYREAGWDEKRLEQKENSADVTIAPAAPESPSPEPAYERNLQMNLGPSGV